GLDHGQPGGVPIARLRELADRLRAARYAVIAWDAGRLDFPHADLAVEAICGLIEDLNSGTRCAGLPLGGSDGASTWLQAATWQTGFPGRVSFAGGYPAHDPYRLDARRLLASGEADALVWISAFDAGLVPPPTDCPTVVLGRNGMTPEREPEVLVPVGTPGLDHTGHAFRFDGVATLPLAALRTGPAAVAEVLERIERVV
ncbi:MAG: formylmethanofuran dehydrogenase subunit B, partial [Gammaproteobacteria bacterium]|nr:formylmethanofuran dehydrogenase subunit B [Gammaproteobacteria bacterium]